MARILIVPGLGGSGPAHWQSWLHAELPGSLRVEQQDSNSTDLPVWTDTLCAAIDTAAEPVWLVAHSFGCLATLCALTRRPSRVAGALLVAPADPEKFGLAHLLPEMIPALPVKAVVSSNDPWMPLAKAELLLNQLGIDTLNLGEAGHINAESGFGPWPQGLALLHQLQGI